MLLENKRYRPERHRGYFAEFSSALFHTDIVTMPNSKGAYALIFSLKGETQQVIGKLGLSCFRPVFTDMRETHMAVEDCELVCSDILRPAGGRIGISIT